MWGGADYERIARAARAGRTTSSSRALEPRSRASAGWTSRPARARSRCGRRARAPSVTGVDISGRCSRGAREGGARRPRRSRSTSATRSALPYEDASFDVVASCFGVIFAPDARRRSRASSRRVCRPGGRLGLTTWLPDDGDRRASVRALRAATPPAAATVRWGDAGARRASCWAATSSSRSSGGRGCYEADSPEELWELSSTSTPPIEGVRRVARRRRRSELREACVELWERYRDG